MASLRPFQLVVAAASLPPIVRIVTPAASRTWSCHRVAPPPAASENPATSLIPSPFGEMSALVAEAEVIVGSIRSILTANVAIWLAVTGRFDGA